MRGQIVLNGISSNLIDGLLIQTLPNITKPLMRTEIEEIDGRDGDFVTKLGYSAYDKEIEIGLYGNYDIDQVIEFFNSEGTVIFSNEPEKYYQYQIIEQIDFEKLIRYKTATVTFHCQPFKYSAVETQIKTDNILSIPEYSKTLNGVKVSFTDGKLTISGTASEPSEFYIPIKEKSLISGNYRLTATSGGTGYRDCAVGVMSSARMLGNKVLILSQSSVNLTQDQDINVNYLWVGVTKAQSYDVEVDVALYANHFVLLNEGNTSAKPIMTVYGQGEVTVSLNEVPILAMFISTDHITIDAEAMDAYCGDILCNRAVIGNYDDLTMPVGKNILSWTGKVTQVLLEKYSRWI